MRIRVGIFHFPALNIRIPSYTRDLEPAGFRYYIKEIHEDI